MKHIKSYRDLEVYQRAYDISLEIHHLTLTAMPQFEKYELGSQMRRASKSIPANIAEGFGKQRAYSLEFKRYLQIAIGSSDEMKVWVQYCVDLNYVETETARKWFKEYQELSKMLNGLQASWLKMLHKQNPED